MRNLPNLERLTLGGVPISDAGLERLAGLKRLESLDIANSQIEGHSLASIARLPRLRELRLWHNEALKDESLEHLRGATQLRKLQIGYNVRITPAGLTRLKSLTDLEELVIGDALTGAWGRDLKKALPKTKVVFFP